MLTGWRPRPVAAVLALMIAVSAVTPLLAGEYWRRWFAMPNILFAANVPLLTAILFFALGRSLQKRRRYRPFLIALGIFLTGMIGLGISMWPFVVPRAVNIWQAAAPERSQVFMLIGVADHHADHPCLYGVELLGVSRQGRQRGLSLSWPDLRLPDEPRPLARKIGWMVIIWTASVALLGAVTMVLRWWLTP